MAQEQVIYGMPGTLWSSFIRSFEYSVVVVWLFVSLAAVFWAFFVGSFLGELFRILNTKRIFSHTKIFSIFLNFSCVLIYKTAKPLHGTYSHFIFKSNKNIVKQFLIANRFSNLTEDFSNF